MTLAGSGMTILCVTHEMSLARQMANRVVFMDKGRILEASPPAEFFGQPKCARTGEFLSRIISH